MPAAHTVELVFPRAEAWVVHHALAAAERRATPDTGSESERSHTEPATDGVRLTTDAETSGPSVRVDALTSARRGIETGRVRFTRAEADSVRSALSAYLPGAPMRDLKPGGDALRRVRGRIE